MAIKRLAEKLGKVTARRITEEMKESYLDYAMSVIISRALPDVRDGLKPVQRRILYSMHEMGLKPEAGFRKCATVVGRCMGSYHPHGDLPLYGALVRMAQDFSLRYPLIQPQGNFGCFTKDTKVKLTDGRSLSFGELIKEQKQGKRHWTFVFNPESKKIEISEIKNPRVTRREEKIIKITLDNDKEIKCSLDHCLMLRDGSYREAQDLRPGDSLMPFYSKLYDGKSDLNLKGYKVIWQPFERKWQFVHRVDYTLKYFDNFSEIVEGAHYNHKVVTTELLLGGEDLYDLTTEPWHNFALDAGVFVHNSIDNDPPASMRYTEAKLSRIGQETLKDIGKDTVDFMENYDGTRKEPKVLPSPLPQLVLNGTLGIAVGMATNIPPHNLNELCEALIYLLDYPQADTQDLFQFIQGPDFPTGGIIYNQEAIIEAYSQGRGSVVVRGRTEIVEDRKGGFKILISEIPFGVRKSALVEQIAHLIRENKLKGVKDIRDESDREGMRVVVELKKGTHPKRILNRLYKFSGLQSAFHLNSVALIKGLQPKLLSLAELLSHFLIHRQEVILRRTKFDLNSAQERVHILEGLSKALDKIDAVIKTIKGSRNKEEAEKNLIRQFKFTRLQARAILDLRLSTLARLERKKIEDELKETLALIKELSAILKSPKKIQEIIKKELRVYQKEFGDSRRTKVYPGRVEEISTEDLIGQESTIITATREGFIKRIKPATYSVQRRGGKGILGMKTGEEDFVKHLILANTYDWLLFFTSSGRAFKIRCFEIPEADRRSRGRNLVNFLEIPLFEKVLEIILQGKDESEGYLIMATKNGIVKKTPLQSLANIRRTGLIAINLKKKDSLREVTKTTGDKEIILITKKGQAIRFGENEIRAMGRTAAGVKGMRLKREDEVIGMGIIKSQKSPSQKLKQREKKEYLLVISENGYGKRTSLSEYRKQKRGGSGIKTAKLTQKTGDLVATRILSGLEKHLILISEKGQVIKVKVDSISKLGRVTQGVRIMKLSPDDRVASITTI